MNRLRAYFTRTKEPDQEYAVLALPPGSLAKLKEDKALGKPSTIVPVDGVIRQELDRRAAKRVARNFDKQDGEHDYWIAPVTALSAVL